MTKWHLLHPMSVGGPTHTRALLLQRCPGLSPGASGWPSNEDLWTQVSLPPPHQHPLGNMVASQGFPGRLPSSLWLVLCGPPISPNYTVDRHVWGLEVILPHVFIVKGGLGHSLTRATGPDIGRNIDSQGQLGHGVSIGG